MDFPTDLANTLHELILGVELEDADLADPLHALLRDTKLAVRSFLGLELVWVVDGQALRVTALGTEVAAEDVLTSLWLPLDALTSAGAPHPVTLPRRADQAGDALTFYAGTPGAFVDLAADLSYILGLPDPDSAAVGPGPARVVLDRHLTPGAMDSGVTGRAELTVIHQAAGVLIERGHPPDDAVPELGRRSTAAGLTVYTYAEQLVRQAMLGHTFPGEPPGARSND